MISIVGAGYWGKNLVRNYAELGVLKSVCDANAQALTELEKQFPGSESHLRRWTGQLRLFMG